MRQSRSLSWLLKAFLTHLEVERGLSPNTLLAYRSDCERFIGSLPQELAEAPEGVREKEVADFLVTERKRERSPTSARRSLAAVRTFFKFLVREGVVPANPARNVDNPRVWARLPAFLRVEEMARLLDGIAASDARYPLRDQAMLELVYASGLRVGELLTLKLESVRPDLGIVRCLGKGSKERIVPVSQRALGCLSRYLEKERPRLVGRRTSDVLFVSRGGRPLGREVIRALLRKYALQAGLAGRVTPHTLRHSFATHMIQGGADLRVVQEMLGHARVDTTEIYTHLDRGDLRATIKRYHPRG